MALCYGIMADSVVHFCK